MSIPRREASARSEPRAAPDRCARHPVSDSTHVRDVGLAAAADDLVWRYAAEQGLTIVSKDADFHERSFLLGRPPKVIWIRRGNCSTDEVLSLLQEAHPGRRGESGDRPGEILRYIAVHDVGTVVNPKSLRGQISGGIAQGIGMALYEQLRRRQRRRRRASRHTPGQRPAWRPPAAAARRRCQRLQPHQHGRHVRAGCPRHDRRVELHLAPVRGEFRARRRS